MDLYQCRIQTQLETMSSTLLITLPSAETWSPEQFLTETKARCEIGTQILKAASEKVEDSVEELLSLLRASACLPELHSFDTEDTMKAKKGTYVFIQYCIMSHCIQIN